MASPPRDQIRDMRVDNYFRIKNNVIDHHLYRVGLAGFAVYGVLVRYAGNKNQRCFPSQKTVAGIVGCSKTTVRKALSALRKEGLISVVEKGRKGRTFHVYTLLEGAKTQGLTGTDSDTGSKSVPAGSDSVPAGSKSVPAGSDSVHELNEITKRLGTKRNQQDGEREQVVIASSMTAQPTRNDSICESLSPEDFAFAAAILDNTGIRARGKQVAGAVRSLWALTSGDQSQRRSQFEAAVDVGASLATEVSRVFAIAMSHIASGRAA